MFDQLTNPGVWIVTVLLMVFIYWQQRTTHKKAFKTGITVGVELGIRQTAALLTDGKYMVQSTDGNRVEVTDELLHELSQDILTFVKLQADAILTKKKNGRN